MIDTNNVLLKLEEFKQLKVENVNLPCKKCDGDCCGPDLQFSKKDLIEIEKYHSLKRLKKESALDGNSFTLSTKGIKNTKCVFLKNNKCSIYNVRPEICKHYGERIYAQCPYNGFKEIPDSQEERNRLTTKVQSIFFNKIEELGANFNLIPATARNVFRDIKNKE